MYSASVSTQGKGPSRGATLVPRNSWTTAQGQPAWVCALPYRRKHVITFVASSWHLVLAYTRSSSFQLLLISSFRDFPSASMPFHSLVRSSRSRSTGNKENVWLLYVSDSPQSAIASHLPAYEFKDFPPTRRHGMAFAASSDLPRMDCLFSSFRCTSAYWQLHDYHLFLLVTFMLRDSSIG